MVMMYGKQEGEEEREKEEAIEDAHRVRRREEIKTTNSW